MAEDPTFPGGILIRRLIEMIPFAIVLGAVLYFRVGGLEEDLHEIRTTVQSDGKEIHKISAELRIYNAQFSNQQTTFQQLNAGEHAEHDRRIKTLDSEVDRMREKVERLERRLIQSGLQGESR